MIALVIYDWSESLSSSYYVKIKILFGRNNKITSKIKAVSRNNYYILILFTLSIVNIYTANTMLLLA